MPHHHKDITGALLLITLGIVLFLNNLGFLPWSIWGNLFKFWPVLLILAGIQTILGRSTLSQIIMFFLTAFVFIFIIGYSVRTSTHNSNQWLPSNLPDVFPRQR